MTIIDAYNELIDLMNELENNGHYVHDFCDPSCGYGFYAECKNNHYISVKIFRGIDIEYYISVNRHNSKCSYDVINDIELKSYNKKTTSVDEVYTYVNELIKFDYEEHITIEFSEIEARIIIDFIYEHSNKKYNNIEVLKKIVNKISTKLDVVHRR